MDSLQTKVVPWLHYDKCPSFSSLYSFVCPVEIGMLSIKLINKIRKLKRRCVSENEPWLVRPGTESSRHSIYWSFCVANNCSFLLFLVRRVLRFPDCIHFFVSNEIRCDHRGMRSEFPIVFCCNAQDMVNFLLPTSVTRQGYSYITFFFLLSVLFFFLCYCCRKQRLICLGKQKKKKMYKNNYKIGTTLQSTWKLFHDSIMTKAPFSPACLCMPGWESHKTRVLFTIIKIKFGLKAWMLGRIHFRVLRLKEINLNE